MCLILPSRVISMDARGAEVELPDGIRAIVGTDLKPHVTVGQYVLVDRGQVLEIIEADEAEAILAIYAELVTLPFEGSGAGPPDGWAAMIEGNTGTFTGTRGSS
jgi:hydrogenase assembly chaperone HypC/HupF